MPVSEVLWRGSSRMGGAWLVRKEGGTRIGRWEGRWGRRDEDEDENDEGAEVIDLRKVFT